MSNTHAKLAAVADDQADEAKLLWDKEMAAPLSVKNGEDMDLVDNRFAEISTLAQAHWQRCSEIREEINGMKKRIEWLKDRARTHHQMFIELDGSSGTSRSFNSDAYRLSVFQQALHSIDRCEFGCHFASDEDVPF